VILHPEYRDPAYGIGKDGPKVFRSGDPKSTYYYNQFKITDDDPLTGFVVQIPE
jgi:hypothetical protein